MQKKVVIVGAKRTAVASFNGSLANISAVDLGAIVISDLLCTSKISPSIVDDVIMGHVLQTGCGQNPARQAALKAGLPKEVSALTINQVCGSGLKAVALAAQAIRAGDSEIVIAGGQESMSLSPHFLRNSRKGTLMGDVALVDSMLNDGLMDAYNHYHMGITAENLVDKYKITREEQDEFALKSQQKAFAAQEAGKFKPEIVPVIIPQKKGEPIVFDSDEFIKPKASLESLAKLKPAFKKDGTVTAGNSSGINDGAAAVLLMSEDKANELGLEILAYVEASANAGLEPELMGRGPIYAVKKVLNKTGWKLDDLDVIEANEAFAAQSIAVNKELAWNIDKVNINGGAIAIGHPIGGSGCRILVTLIHEMLAQDAKKGLATLCIGGGMGVALAISRK